MTSPLVLNDLILARLETLDATVTVYEGKVPEKPSDLYVAYYPSPGVARNSRHVQVPGRLTWSFYAICVGPDLSRVLWLAEEVRSRMAGWRPVADLATGPLNETDLGNDPLPDDTVPGALAYSFTLRYTLTTTRSLNG